MFGLRLSVWRIWLPAPQEKPGSREVVVSAICMLFFGVCREIASQYCRLAEHSRSVVEFDALRFSRQGQEFFC